MKTLKDVIALKFKTSESEGVILHGEGQQGDYITLELNKAKLVLSLNLGVFSLAILFPPIKFPLKTLMCKETYVKTVDIKKENVNLI